VQQTDSPPILRVLGKQFPIVGMYRKLEDKGQYKGNELLGYLLSEGGDYPSNEKEEEEEDFPQEWSAHSITEFALGEKDYFALGCGTPSFLRYFVMLQCSSTLCMSTSVAFSLPVIAAKTERGIMASRLPLWLPPLLQLSVGASE